MINIRIKTIFDTEGKPSPRIIDGVLHPFIGTQYLGDNTPHVTAWGTSPQHVLDQLMGTDDGKGKGGEESMDNNKTENAHVATDKLDAMDGRQECGACGNAHTVGVFKNEERGLEILLCDICEKTSMINGFSKVSNI